MERSGVVKYTLAVVLVIALLQRASAESWSYTIARGKVTASPTQAADCHFPIGQQGAVSIDFHPKSMSCVRMKEFIGRSIRVQVVSEE